MAIGADLPRSDAVRRDPDPFRYPSGPRHGDGLMPVHHGRKQPLCRLASRRDFIAIQNVRRHVPGMRPVRAVSGTKLGAREIRATAPLSPRR